MLAISSCPAPTLAPPPIAGPASDYDGDTRGVDSAGRASYSAAASTTDARDKTEDGDNAGPRANAPAAAAPHLAFIVHISQSNSTQANRSYHPPSTLLYLTLDRITSSFKRLSSEAAQSSPLSPSTPQLCPIPALRIMTAAQSSPLSTSLTKSPILSSLSNSSSNALKPRCDFSLDFEALTHRLQSSFSGIKSGDKKERISYRPFKAVI